MPLFRKSVKEVCKPILIDALLINNLDLLIYCDLQRGQHSHMNRGAKERLSVKTRSSDVWQWLSRASFDTTGKYTV